MTRAIIGKRFTFEAAHSLPYHEGRCRRLHGHSYRLEVSVSGDVRDAPGSSDHGMVLDFSVLSLIVKGRVIGVLDHQYINEVLPGLYPTAENLAAWIGAMLQEGLDGLGRAGLRAEAVRLWETESSSATWTTALDPLD